MIRELVQAFKNDKVVVAGDMNGHTGLLDESVNHNGKLLIDFAEEENMEILNHTIGQGRVTWKGRLFESAIDYLLVNEKARERVKELIIDEDGLMDIDTDHNPLILELDWTNDDSRHRDSTYNNRSRYLGRTDVYWRWKEEKAMAFEVDLAELDCIYGENPAEMNDCLTKRLNEGASRHFKKCRYDKKKRKKGKGNKPWWSKDIEKAIKVRRKTNRKNREMFKKFKKGEISEESRDHYWKEYIEAKDKAGRMINDGVEEHEKRLLKKAREQGRGENRDWYNFIKGEGGNSFDYPDSIVIEGKVITKQDIKQEIEKCMEEIAREPKAKMKYTFKGESIEQRGEI